MFTVYVLLSGLSEKERHLLLTRGPHNLAQRLAILHVTVTNRVINCALFDYLPRPVEEIQERAIELSLRHLQSRKEDASVKEREHALQSLDLAYHKYKEITRNLDEGLQVRAFAVKR